MPKKIVDELTIGSRSPRSIALDRDLYDASALEGYLVTPAAVAALTQLGEGLHDTSRQRAWRVVGPYGSGKSALGLVSAQLLAGPVLFPGVADKVAKSAPDTAALFMRSRRCPVAVVGSRVAFGAALARAVSRVVAPWKSKAAAALRKQLNEEAGTYGAHPLNSAVGQLVCDFADSASAEGFEGVVLFVDELGKFIEHAALHPEDGDLMSLQQLAEQACGSTETRIAVVAMLHQHFSSYATAVGRGLSDEWEKVASRFEEIPFDEPVERYAHFAAHALGVSRAVLTDKGIGAHASGLYARAAALNVLRSHSASDAELFKNPQQLYPIHPIVIAALAVVAKRFGQSERSFHAFLRSDEPHALRDFAQRTTVHAEHWFRLTEAFDHLVTGYGLRFRDRSAERRWAFAVASVESEQTNATASAVLKTIALLELIQVGLRLPVSAAVIYLALDGIESGQIDEALADLVRRGVLLQRRSKSEYALAIAEVANIEALYEVAAREDEARLVFRGVTAALAQRLTTGNRHYDTTGTLRTMGTVVGTPKAWPEIPKRHPDDLNPDGWLKLLLVTKGSKEVDACERRFAEESDPLVIHACLALQPAARLALVDYSVWLAVHHQLSLKQLDPWASQHVDMRLQEAREAVDRLVVAEVTPEKGRRAPRYWHQGRPIEGSERMSLGQLASWLFDAVFTSSPHVVNELINKDRPPSAIVLARQRMFDVLLGGDNTRPICGATEYPPERLIHRTLLRDTGIWSEKDGVWSLQAPTKRAAVRIEPVWNAISKMLAEERPHTLAEIIQSLAAPPLGVRNAPAGIWVALYLMVHRSRCAILERGTLLLEMTAEHLQRMYKNPGTFELRELPVSAISAKLLAEYRAALAAVGAPVAGDLTHLEVARTIYRWMARLPSYAVETMQVSKDTSHVRSLLRRSQDPIGLLAEKLPQAYRESKAKDGFGSWLSRSLTELGLAQRKLQDAASGVLGRTFEIAGPLSRIRAQLQRECSEATSDLAEAHLKSFILRCADLTLTDERWLDSVASLVVQRPLDAWNDDTLGRFEADVSELCGHYKRWIKVVMHRGRNPKVGERFVSLTLTLPSGEESSLFLVTSDRAKRVATEVLKSVTLAAGDDRDLVSAALAQAMLDHQSQAAAASKKKDEASESRKAS